MDDGLLSVPKLGFGCMRLPLLDSNDQTSIDIEQFKRMVDVFMESGCTYFDTAYIYHDGASETALREALVKRYPRSSYMVATKCLAWAYGNADQAQAGLGVSLERLGLDYVDLYLLHNVGGNRTARFDAFGMWDFVKRKKAEGLIRNVGFSIHDGADALEMLLDKHPDMDFVQLQVNYLDWDDPVVESRRCMEVAAAHGVPVVIMEPARGGRLVDLPQRAADILRAADPEAGMASWAYRFCWNLPGVVTVLSGMSTLEQVQENTAAYKDDKPFSGAERQALEDAVAALRSVPTIPCTNCRYCMGSCPQNVQIPQIISLLNLAVLVDSPKFARELYSWQVAAGPASRCISCGACEALCPQKIDIVDQLARAAALFE